MAPLLARGFAGATQLDFVNREENIWAQMDFNLLREIHKRHPECVFLLPTRPVADHVQSIMNWNLHMPHPFHKLITQYEVPGLPAGVGAHAQELADWIEWHQARVRELCYGWPFLEFDIRRNPGAQLSKVLGVSVRRWMWNLRNPRLNGKRQGER